ncbi:MAG TPA: T9SS type A sorting domain-containing protein [Bacteroidia bacterium]|nr:T9SS type A sorting domain-containing protein [Bacteroidia bacterium]
MTNSKFSQESLIKILCCFMSACIFTLSSLCGYAQCPLPADLGPISGAAVTCPGNSKVYSFAAASGATSYTWTLPTGCSILGQNPYTGAALSKTVVFGPSFTPPGTISVRANNACGSSTPSTKLISANYPQMSTISGTNTACPDDTIIYSVAVNPSFTYTWTVSANMTINSGQGTNLISVIYNPAFVSGSVGVSGDNGCGSGPVRTKAVALHTPTKPSVISGSIDACPNSTVNYSVTPAANTNYDWTAPAGTVIAGQGTENVSITFPAAFITGTISVRARTKCGISGARTLKVYGVPAKPGIITGTASAICNSTQVYTIAPVISATSYIWTGTAGSTITAGQGTTTATISFPGTVSGNIIVKPSNTCGTGKQRTLAVTGNIVIAQHPQNLAVCEDDTTTLTVSAPGTGLTYQWRQAGTNLADNADFAGTQTPTLSILKVDSLNAGNYDVVISSTCAASVTSSPAAFTVNMKPPMPGDVTSAPVACAGTSGVLTIPLSVYNTTGYFWTAYDAIITGGQGTTSISVDYGITGHSGYQFYCHGTNGCGLSKIPSSHWIRRSVSTPHIQGSHYVCSGSSGISYTSPGVNGASSYTWSMSTPDMTLASGQGTLSVLIDFSPGFTRGDLYLTASNLCMTTPPRIFHVYVDTSCRVAGEIINIVKKTETSSFIAPQIYPNPAADNLYLEFIAPERINYEASLTDMLGKNVHAEPIIAVEGKNSFMLDLKDTNNGLYIFKLKSSDTIYQEKIIINK